MSVNFDEYIRLIKKEEDIFHKARLIKHLIDKKGIKVKTIARNLSVSSSYICNMLRALKLPELIRDGFYAKLVSPTHLFVLARLQKHEDMIKVYEETLAKNFSTTELEERVRAILHGVETIGDKAPAETKAAIMSSIESVDPESHTKVVQTRVKTRIIIEKKGSFEDTTKFLKKLSKKLNTDSQ